MDGVAMVQMVENWTAVDAVVVAPPRPADLPDFDAVELRVDRAGPVAGFANLLGDAAGKSMTVLAPRERLAGLCAGASVRLKVRRAPGRLFANPDEIVRR